MKRTKRWLRAESVDADIVGRNAGWINIAKESKGTKWFNEYGFLTKRIPSACIKACSGSGKKDDAIKTWVYNLQFFIPDNLLDQAIDYLREFGAWDENELQKWKATEDFKHNIAQHVLWNFCCDVAEGNLRQSELCLGH